MVAGLKSGGASPPPQPINPREIGSFPQRAIFFAAVRLAYFGATLTAGMALNSAWVSGAVSSPPSWRSAL